MPSRPLRPCTTCGRPTAGRCACQAAAARARARLREQNRPTPAQRGYGAAWRRIRQAVVAEHLATHGRVCPGWDRPPHAVDERTQLHVDHRTPLGEGGTDDRSNLVVLCKSCHGSKTAADRRRRGRGRG